MSKIMATFKGDQYVIDKVDGDGRLTRIQIFSDWKSAKSAWAALKPDDCKGVSTFLGRISLRLDGSESLTTMDCK